MALWHPITQSNGYDASYWRITEVQLNWGNQTGRVVISGYKNRETRLDSPQSAVMERKTLRINSAQFEQHFAAGQDETNLEQTQFTREFAYQMMKAEMEEFAEAEDYLEVQAMYSATNPSYFQMELADESISRHGEVTSWTWTVEGVTTTIDATAAGYTDGDEDFSKDFGAPGTYPIKLEVNDSEGYTHVLERDLVIPPIADASFQTETDALEATLTDGSSSRETQIEQWEWDFGDGDTLSVDATASGYTEGDESPTHVYDAKDTYTVTLTVTDAEGYTQTETKEVFVEPVPTSQFSASASHLAANFEENSQNIDVESWNWSFGDGTSMTIDATASAYEPGDEDVAHIYNSPGTYTVSLETVAKDGNVYNTQTDLLIVILAEASFTSTKSGLTADFSDGSTSDGGSVKQWAWDFGDGNTQTVDATSSDYASGDENVSHTYASSGTYAVTLEIIDSEGYVHDVTKEVTVS